jgi:hypothetical protein
MNPDIEKFKNALRFAFQISVREDWDESRAQEVMAELGKLYCDEWGTDEEKARYEEFYE